MDVQGSIVVTCISVVFLTAFTVAFWFLSEKPVISNTSQGKLYPPVFLGLRPGGEGINSRNMRANAILGVVGISFIYLVACALGYFWWSGVAGWGFLLMSSFDFQYPKITKPEFHMQFRVFGVALLSLGVAWGLAWATYCGWFVLPLIAFHVLNLMSITLFLWVAFVPMSK